MYVRWCTDDEGKCSSAVGRWLSPRTSAVSTLSSLRSCTSAHWHHRSPSSSSSGLTGNTAPAAARSRPSSALYSTVHSSVRLLDITYLLTCVLTYLLAVNFSSTVFQSAEIWQRVLQLSCRYSLERKTSWNKTFLQALSQTPFLHSLSTHTNTCPQLPTTAAQPAVVGTRS